MTDVTCWGHPTAEELQAYADRERESIPNYELLWVLNEWVWRSSLTRSFDQPLHFISSASTAFLARRCASIITAGDAAAFLLGFVLVIDFA
jgi:hypothetical protein